MSTPNKPKGRQPDLAAYNVVDLGDGKGHWNRVGAAWQHRDGKGFDISLDSVPVSGRVTLREMYEERTEELEAQEQSQAPERSAHREKGRAR